MPRPSPRRLWVQDPGCQDRFRRRRCGGAFVIGGTVYRFLALVHPFLILECCQICLYFGNLFGRFFGGEARHESFFKLIFELEFREFRVLSADVPEQLLGHRKETAAGCQFPSPWYRLWSLLANERWCSRPIRIRKTEDRKCFGGNRDRAIRSNLTLFS